MTKLSEEVKFYALLEAGISAKTNDGDWEVKFDKDYNLLLSSNNTTKFNTLLSESTTLLANLKSRDADLSFVEDFSQTSLEALKLNQDGLFDINQIVLY